MVQSGEWLSCLDLSICPTAVASDHRRWMRTEYNEMRFIAQVVMLPMLLVQPAWAARRGGGWSTKPALFMMVQFKN
jgi:hypothetical protein